MSRLLGVVLCGGRSRRMGRDKAQIVRPDGATYLENAIAQLSPLCADVWLSGVRDYRGPHHVVADPVVDQGPITGIVASLCEAARTSDAAAAAIEPATTAVSYDACLVTAVDMPRLVTNDLTHLCDCWNSSPNSVVCAISKRQQRLQPLVAIYPIDCLDDLSRWAGEDRSLRRWLASYPHHRVSLADRSCLNVNTPEDLSDDS